MIISMAKTANASITWQASYLDGFPTVSEDSKKEIDDLSLLIKYVSAVTEKYVGSTTKMYITSSTELERLFLPSWTSTDITLPHFSSVTPTSKKFVQGLNVDAPLIQARSAETVIDEIKNYQRDYKDGWDGPDSLAPSEAAMLAATSFLAAIPYAMTLPFPMLSPNGEIGLYWDMEWGYADISFDCEGTATFFSRDRHGKQRYEEVPHGNPGADWYWSRIGALETQFAAA